MGIAEIEEVIAAFAASARRCREGGIDGIEIHAPHGYLIMQFLSPLTNTRTDRSGGSLENRKRFLREIMLAVRAEVGTDYSVGMRVGARTGEGGLGGEAHRPAIRTPRPGEKGDILGVRWSG